MTRAEKSRVRRSGDRLRFFAVTYYGTGNSVMMSDTLKAYSIENANERAEQAMPPGAVTYKVNDEETEGH